MGSGYPRVDTPRVDTPRVDTPRVVSRCPHITYHNITHQFVDLQEMAPHDCMITSNVTTENIVLVTLISASKLKQVTARG